MSASKLAPWMEEVDQNWRLMRSNEGNKEAILKMNLKTNARGWVGVCWQDAATTDEAIESCLSKSEHTYFIKDQIGAHASFADGLH